MKLFRLGAVFALLLPLLASPAISEDLFSVTEKMTEISGWVVGYNGSTGRCMVIGEYDNSTRVAVGRSVSDGSVFLALSNETWKSIEPGKPYELTLTFANASPISSEFIGQEDSGQTALFSGQLAEPVLKVFAHSLGLEVFYQNKSLGRFGLRGTKRAVREIEKCVRKVSSRQTSDPFATGADAGQPKVAAPAPAKPAATAAKPPEAAGPKIDFSVDTEEKTEAFGAYLRTFDAVERSYDSQRRYYSWCCKDLKKGPTNEGNMSFGLYSDSGDGPRLPEPTPSIMADPGIAALQARMQELVTSYSEAVSVINEAEKYYEAETYKIDDAEQAREIHSRLHPLLQTFRVSYVAAAKAVLANMPAYSDVMLPALIKDGDEMTYAYTAAFSAYKTYILSKRAGVKGKALKAMLGDVQQTIGEYKRFVDNAFMDALISAADDTIKNCTEEFWIKAGQCDDSPFD